MSSPRHLWSGDWELDSAAARQELARRRAQSDEPAGPPPAPERPPARPSAAARAVAWLRHQTGLARAGLSTVRSRSSRKLRIALLVALVGLVSAGVAYGITTLLVGSGGSASASGPPAYLGVHVVGSPFGILVTVVTPGSPAARAGLLPGDTITAINNEPISTNDDVTAALRRAHAGETIPVAFTRALTPYTVQVRLAHRPPGYP